MTTPSNNSAIAILERLVVGGRCKFDMLNPCFDNRPHDTPGKHADGTEACAFCTARAFLATHNTAPLAGELSRAGADEMISAGLRWYKDRDMTHELPDEVVDLMIGNMVSIDMSTCDDDADHRVFGKILEVQTPAPDGSDRVWLCGLDQVNFEMEKGTLADCDARAVLSFAYKAPLTAGQEEFLDRVSDTLYPNHKDKAMNDQVDVDDINELAQFIRQTNGNNDLGAAALAERILEWQAKSTPKGATPNPRPRLNRGVVAIWDGERRATAILDEPQRSGWLTRIPLAPVTHDGPARYWVVQSMGNSDETPPLFIKSNWAETYANELEQNGWTDVEIIPLARLQLR